MVFGDFSIWLNTSKVLHLNVHRGFHIAQQKTFSDIVYNVENIGKRKLRRVNRWKLCWFYTVYIRFGSFYYPSVFNQFRLEGYLNWIKNRHVKKLCGPLHVMNRSLSAPFNMHWQTKDPVYLSFLICPDTWMKAVSWLVDCYVIFTNMTDLCIKMLNMSKEWLV